MRLSSIFFVVLAFAGALLLFWGETNNALVRGGALFVSGILGVALDAISGYVKLLADVAGAYRDDRRGLHPEPHDAPPAVG